jgi:peptidoglycan/LPS O-acetylase OafA/YrhL
MDALFLGVLAAIMMRDERQKRWIQSRPVGILVCVLALGMAAFTIQTPTPDNPVMQSFGYTWVALFYTSVLVYAVTRTDSVLSRLLRLKWLGWLGGLAYGVYLLHQTVNGMLFGLVWKREPFIQGGSSLLTTLTAIVLTLMVAQLSWRYFEAPLIRKFRSQYQPVD